MSHFDPPPTLKNGKKSVKESAHAPSNERQLRVSEIASELGLTPRHLARLAKAGIPGVERAVNGYRFAWYDRPETRRWISDRKKFRKGQRKVRGASKTQLSKVQLLTRAMRRAETNLARYVEAVLQGKVTAGQLAAIEDAGRRLERLAARILLRAQTRARDGL